MNQRDIFFAALDKATAEERAAYLDGACGADLTLRRRLEDLLKEHFAEDSLLKEPGSDGAPTRLDLSPVAEGPGTQIGRYKLLQKLGEGGFGVVYMAEQKEPIKRRVALKIIQLGMDTIIEREELLLPTATRRSNAGGIQGRRLHCARMDRLSVFSPFRHPITRM